MPADAAVARSDRPRDAIGRGDGLDGSSQDVGRFNLAVIVMAARSNQLRELRPLIAEVLAVCRDILPGQVLTIG